MRFSDDTTVLLTVLLAGKRCTQDLAEKILPASTSIAHSVQQEGIYTVIEEAKPLSSTKIPAFIQKQSEQGIR